MKRLSIKEPTQSNMMLRVREIVFIIYLDLIKVSAVQKMLGLGQTFWILDFRPDRPNFFLIVLESVWAQSFLMGRLAGQD